MPSPGGVSETQRCGAEEDGSAPASLELVSESGLERLSQLKAPWDPSSGELRSSPASTQQEMTTGHSTIALPGCSAHTEQAATASSIVPGWDRAPKLLQHHRSDQVGLQQWWELPPKHSTDSCAFSVPCHPPASCTSYTGQGGHRGLAQLTPPGSTFWFPEEDSQGPCRGNGHCQVHAHPELDQAGLTLCRTITC